MPKNPHKEAVEILGSKALASEFLPLSCTCQCISELSIAIIFKCNTQMNQVHDGSFSDALYATLLLKDPLRD